MARTLQQATDVNLLDVSFQVSLAGRQLLNLLLNNDPADRLGSNSGANEIKQYPFFRGIKWPPIRTMSPPPLDAPFELIEKDLKAKDVKWEDDGVLLKTMKVRWRRFRHRVILNLNVHLVELQETGELYAMKAMEKSIMINRNKVHRVCAEREIMLLLDHPFLPTLYASFQTPTHICLITDFCSGGELFALLDRQPMKLFKEESTRFYAAKVVIGLEYLHCLGIIYRDLKPENILLQKDGHIVLSDFDLSFMTSYKPRIIKHPPPNDKRRSKSQPLPTFLAEPVTVSNSFVGTEEYIAPEIITGASHSSAIDWWALVFHLGRTFRFHEMSRQIKWQQATDVNLLDVSFQVSLAGRLLNLLLNRDPVDRLGSNSGANEIKHLFFRGINWPLIRTMSLPPLDVPPKLIEKYLKAKDVKWEDDGVFVNPVDLDLF
ncbi:hypothetical protein Pint_33587 [Pistacia integerrima]|uniref:Uncharacterized protein n=1 Tax=Pistacia integerrima TaxID=434235 RepID=A0ACC0X3V6_9ROSI|nr:hypothetical protein Pint_33587 [Pistacia integerrima]